MNGWPNPSNDVEATQRELEEIVNTPEDALATIAKKRKVANINEHCLTLLSTYQECINLQD